MYRAICLSLHKNLTPMEELHNTFQLLLQRTPTSFVRYLHDQIDWSSRLIAILGSRGVGKSTMILQHIKMHEKVEETLYVTADDFYFTTHRLYDLAREFFTEGGKVLYIDEIHKYKGWSQEIKNIYDQLPDLRVVYSGSSILELEKGGADLSRRKIEYLLPGLSFREYVNLSQGWNLPPYTLNEILEGKVEFPFEHERPIKLFHQYMKEGYYPFFIEGNYHLRLQGVIKQIVDEDIPNYAAIALASRSKLRKLLYILAQSVPFKPNYSKLEKDLNISRNTLPDYINYLEKAGLILALRENTTGLKLLEKVEKIYLQNPNLAYALSETTPDVGNMRENIFLAWMQVTHRVTSSKASDFEIDGYTFEVGGKNKGQLQLRGTSDGYVVRDGIEYASRNTIPLWMFGFIY